MAFVNVRGLHKTYDSGAIQFEALRGIDLEIVESEILCVIGPSGCGKSTLLNCLSGIDDPTQGYIYIDDTDISRLPDAQKTRFRALNMGFIFQFYNLIPVLTAVENVELAVLTAGVPSRQARKQATEILVEVGLENQINHMPSQLSGGERQRVSIARALVHRPRIVWADEPTGALDTKTSMDLLNLIQRLNRQFHQTFVIVTHDERMAAFSNRILKMDSGKILSIEANNPAPEAQNA